MSGVLAIWKRRLTNFAMQSANVRSAPLVAALYAAWRRLGVSVTTTPRAHVVDLESLILATADLAAVDERLTICAVSWLARFHVFVDGRRLSELTRAAPPKMRAYLGAILSLAIDAPGGARRAPSFDTALAHCRALRTPRAFYDNMQAVPTYRERMRTQGLPLFRRWGLWHDDLTLKLGSIQDLDWILTVPELRARALCGPSIEASCVALTRSRVTNARSLSRELGATYAATHAAVERLVGRGLMLRQRNGVRQELRLSPLSNAALSGVVLN